MISSLHGHKYTLSSLVVINDDIDNNILVTSGDDGGCIKVWDMESLNCMLSFKSYAEPVNCLEVIRSGLGMFIY